MKYKIISVVTICIFIIAVNDLFAQSSVINEDFKLIANDGSIDDHFGFSTAVDNGIIAVGAPFDDDNGTDSGAAYLFEASTGAQLAKLLPNDGMPSATFGFSIAMQNGIVAVGAKSDGENGADAGAVYLFQVSDASQLDKLVPNDIQAGDEFGNSIAIDNGILVAGAWHADEFGDASGATYLFDVTSGNQLLKLLPDTGNDSQTFGVSVAIDSGIVAIGSRTHFVPGQGFVFAKAYLFDVSTGNQLNILEPDILNLNGDQGGFFSDSIAINNGLVVVGAPQRSVVSDHSGVVYVFDATTGQQLMIIDPIDHQDRDNFGISVSLDDGLLAIGSHQDDENGFNSGSTYLYNVNSGSEINKLLSSDGLQLDLFGNSVAIDGDVIIVGAKDNDENGSNSGSAYVFSGITLGLSDNKLTGINLYPNPSSDKVNLDLPFLIDNSSYQIKIFNSLGKVIKVISKTPINNRDEFIINVSSYKSGMYFVEIQIDKKSVVKKLIIQ